MGFIDAFVQAHHQHRRCIDPLHDGYHSSLRSRIPGNMPNETHACVPRLNFRLPKTKARYPHLPNVRITTRERGNDFQGWAICTDGGARLVNGETLAG